MILRTIARRRSAKGNTREKFPSYAEERTVDRSVVLNGVKYMYVSLNFHTLSDWMSRQCCATYGMKGERVL
jgi:hypothetical protein